MVIANRSYNITKLILFLLFLALALDAAYQYFPELSHTCDENILGRNPLFDALAIGIPYLLALVLYGFILKKVPGRVKGFLLGLALIVVLDFVASIVIFLIALAPNLKYCGLPG